MSTRTDFFCQWNRLGVDTPSVFFRDRHILHPLKQCKIVCRLEFMSQCRFIAFFAASNSNFLRAACIASCLATAENENQGINIMRNGLQNTYKYVTRRFEPPVSLITFTGYESDSFSDISKHFSPKCFCKFVLKLNRTIRF